MDHYTVRILNVTQYDSLIIYTIEVFSQKVFELNVILSLYQRSIWNLVILLTLLFLFSKYLGSHLMFEGHIMLPLHVYMYICILMGFPKLHLQLITSQARSHLHWGCMIVSGWKGPSVVWRSGMEWQGPWFGICLTDVLLSIMNETLSWIGFVSLLELVAPLYGCGGEENLY